MSAPLSIKMDRTSVWPFRAAQHAAWPSSCLPCAFTSAPYRRSSFTMCTLPPAAAMQRGVAFVKSKSDSKPSTAAPFRSKNSTELRLSAHTAAISGVQAALSSWTAQKLFTKAPWRIISRILLMLPITAASTKAFVLRTSSAAFFCTLILTKDARHGSLLLTVL